MSLKPVFERAPLLTLERAVLSNGRYMTDAAVPAQIYQKLKNQSDKPECMEAAVRLAALTVTKPDKEPVCLAVMDQMKKQEEDGGIPGMDFRSSLHVVRAACVLLEMRADRQLLICIGKWIAWAYAHMDDWVNEVKRPTEAADLCELLEFYYRLTGKKAVLLLLRELRARTMDWGSLLRTFSVQRPMKKIVPAAEMKAGMERERAEEGFYTRQYRTCQAELLADGMRTAIANSLYSGNGTEMSAARTGWEKISSWHGAVCGGTTADPVLEGKSPSELIDTASLGAWAEAFRAVIASAQSDEDSDWAWKALDVLVTNGLQTTLTAERVNRLTTAKKPSETYLNSGFDETESLCRLARGWSAAASSAITMRRDGSLDMGLMLDGHYQMRLMNTGCRMHIHSEGQQVTIRIKTQNPQSGTIRIRIPDYLEAELSVNGESLIDKCSNQWVAIDREWRTDDTIVLTKRPYLRLEEGYHQSVSVWYGGILLAAEPKEGNFAYAVKGKPAEKEDEISIEAVQVSGWQTKSGQPGDVPVLPEAIGTMTVLRLKPYVECEGARIAVFPKVNQA